MNEDLLKQVAYYNEITERNRLEIRELKKLVDFLIDKACLRGACENRDRYEFNENTMLSIHKDDVNSNKGENTI